ncbi:hypothetical protein bcgnr5390_13460 [Bacillus luti]|nr:hypothetical protein BC2903_55120 [Bacillus cereus]
MNHEFLKQLFQNYSQPLQQIVENWNGNNTDEIERQIDETFRYLYQQRDQLPSFLIPNVQQEFQKLTTEIDYKSYIGKVVTLTQLIKGGKIDKLFGDSDYMITQNTINKLSLSHGDKLLIRNFREFEEGQGRFEFDLHEKVNHPTPYRVQVNFCYVKTENGQPYVYKDLNGTLEKFPTPLPILHKGDIKEFQPKDGDCIDIAFNTSNPTDTVRVLVKHKNNHEDFNNSLSRFFMPEAVKEEQEEYDTTFSSFSYAKPKTTPKRKTIKNSDKTSKELDVIQTLDLHLFENRRIVVVGGDTAHNNFNSALKQLSAKAEMKYELLSCDSNLNTLENSIRTADVCILNIQVNNRKTSSDVKKLCDKHNVEVTSMTHGGPTQLLLKVEELLIRKNQKESAS